MSATTEAPNVEQVRSGYVLERVYSTKLHFETLRETEDLADSREGQVTIGWDWRILPEGRFEIQLRVLLAPTKSRPERAEVVVIGTFRVEGEALSLGVLGFVFAGGPAILYPYAREAMAGLTGKGAFGALQLAPVNVVEVMKQFEQKKTTAAKQLQDEPDLGVSLGLTVPTALQPAQ